MKVKTKPSQDIRRNSRRNLKACVKFVVKEAIKEMTAGPWRKTRIRDPEVTKKIIRKTKIKVERNSVTIVRRKAMFCQNVSS